MNYVEAYAKYMCHWLIEKFFEDIEFMVEYYDTSCIECL